MIVTDILLDGLFAAVAAIGFGAISDPPMRAFPRIALLAAIGHALRFTLMHCSALDIATASLFAAFAIGMGSLWLGRGVRCPMTCLYIPALLPMVPGIYAYKTVFSLIMFLQSLDRTVESLLLRHTRRLPAGVQYRTCTLHLLSGVCPKQRRPADETLGPRTRCTAHCAESGRRHLLYRHAPAPTRPIHPNHLIYTRMLKQIFYHCNGLEPINRHITRYYLYSPFLDLPVLLTKEMRLSGCIERLFRNNCVKFDTTIGFIKVKQ